MTLPSERYRSLTQITDTLFHIRCDLLLYAKRGAKPVPKKLLKQIINDLRYAVKHFPFHYEIEELAKAKPHILEAPKRVRK